MNVRVQRCDITEIPAVVLVVNLFQGTKKLTGAAAAVDRVLGGLLTREIHELGFEGKEGESFMVPVAGDGLKAKRVMVVGLGESKKFGEETIRRVSASVVRTLRGKGMKTVATVLHGAGIGGRSVREFSAALTEGAFLGSYEFSKYRGRDANKIASKQIKEIIIVEQDAARTKAAAQGVLDGTIASAATVYARDLVNEPASVCVPSHLAEHAREIAKASKGKITARIYGREEVKRRGMGAFLAVAQGAHHEPYFIHLAYRGGKKKVAIVGKGITFDSGGLQIKPGDSMKTMKCDMSGAAAVLGLFSKITEIAPRAEVHGIIAATENTPGPGAYKPGDICRAMNGTTIEIGHTDAEGRVTMADSLSYAVRLKPDVIIDLATLTGACMVALGEDMSGLFTNNEKLGAKLAAAAHSSGERVWKLPLVEEYLQNVKSGVADVKNDSSTRYGGAIHAALFLQEFVGDVPWAHLDIAGPAWAERDTAPYISKGGTGFGVRALINYLKSI